MKPVTTVPSLRRVMSLLQQHGRLKRSGLWNCYICFVLHGLKRLRSDETQLWYFLVRICCLIWTVQYVPLVCILMWTFRSNSMRIDQSEIHNRLDIMCISVFINVHFGSDSLRIDHPEIRKQFDKMCIVCFLCTFSTNFMRIIYPEIREREHMCRSSILSMWLSWLFLHFLYIYTCDWNAKVLQNLQFLFLGEKSFFCVFKVYVEYNLWWYDRSTVDVIQTYEA